MRIAQFAEIETEFIQRAHTMIWCSAATIDLQQRPRSRILHPIWEIVDSADGSRLPVGWITTHRDSHKSRHLEHNPYLSLAYVTNVMQPLYVDCRVEWMTDLDEKKRVWDWFKNTPEPLGFDPAHDFITFDHPNFGLLKLTPWRVDLVNFPAPSFAEGTKVWRGAEVAEAVAVPEVG